MYLSHDHREVSSQIVNVRIESFVNYEVTQGKQDTKQLEVRDWHKSDWVSIFNDAPRLSDSHQNIHSRSIKLSEGWSG